MKTVSAQPEYQPTYELRISGDPFERFPLDDVSDPALRALLTILTFGATAKLTDPCGLEFLYTRLPDAPNATPPCASQDATTSSPKGSPHNSDSAGRISKTRRDPGKVFPVEGGVEGMRLSAEHAVGVQTRDEA